MTIQQQFYTYILASKSNVLYIGVTRSLIKRVWEHKQAILEKDLKSTWWNTENRIEDRLLHFTARYNIDRLLYYEVFEDPENAITREKEMKGWRRSKKIEWIKTMNPNFTDLYFNLL